MTGPGVVGARADGRSLPSVWTTYPYVVLRRRPAADEFGSSLPLLATATRVRLAPARLARYARACGFDSPAAALLTYPHVLAMPLHLRIFAMPEFRLRPMGLIHLANEIEVLGPLEPGMREPLSLEVVARNFERNAIGVRFDVTTLVRRAGEPVWRENCEFLSRFLAPPAGGAARPPRPPKAPRDADVVGEYAVDLRTAWDYARVSKDFNPIHLSDRLATRLGLRGAIVHGMWSLARSVADGSTPVPRPGLRLDTQFLSPVQLPGKVVVKSWTEGAVQRRALCDLRTGRVHMYAGLHAPAPTV